LTETVDEQTPRPDELVLGAALSTHRAESMSRLHRPTVGSTSEPSLPADIEQTGFHELCFVLGGVPPVTGTGFARRVHRFDAHDASKGSHSRRPPTLQFLITPQF